MCLLHAKNTERGILTHAHKNAQIPCQVCLDCFQQHSSIKNMKLYVLSKYSGFTFFPPLCCLYTHATNSNLVHLH